MALRFALTFVLIVGWAVAASSQRVITLHPVQVSGTILQVGPHSVAIKAANGQNWVLNLRQDTKVKITGSAEPEMLAPGTYVRFTATIDKHTTKGQEKIDKLTLFTLTPGVAERTLGIERASEHPKGEEEKNAAGQPGPGGAGPAPGKADAAAPDIEIPEQQSVAPPAAKRRGPGAKLPGKSVPDVAAYDICAQVVSFHNGRLIVNVQNRFFKPKITVELAADAQIGLDLADMSLVKPGDKVAALAFCANLGVCEVTRTIEVALANPLVPPGSRHRPHAVVHSGDTTRRPGGKTKAGDDTTAKKAPVKVPEEEKPADKDSSGDKENPPAKEAEAKPEPALPVADVKPEPKKPEPKEPEKKPPTGDDEKDVFEK